MALEPFATVEDVEEVWGELTVDEAEKVEGWLNVAFTSLRLIGRRRGVDVDQYIAGDPLLQEAAKNAVVASVRRVLLNPNGLRQRSTTMADGPFSDTGSETLDSSISSSRFYFDDDDLIWLPALRRQRFGSFRVKAGLA